MSVLRGDPTSEADLQELVGTSLSLSMAQPLHFYSVAKASPEYTLASYTGVTEFSPENQVVVVKSGTTLERLNKELAKAGQTIPYKVPMRLSMGDVELHALIDYNLPHALEAQCGTWRDWILGMRVVLADGSVRVCGSQAVKNVAGYDVQKLFIGARGTLGVISEVTLKTFPLRAVPSRETIDGRASGNHPHYIHRTTLSQFVALVEEAGDRLITADPCTGTVWASLAEHEELSRAEGDWVIRSGCGTRNLQITDPIQIRLMKRAKEIFDPTGKLNPGGMGIF